MTRCDQVEGRLRTLLDGELSPGESREVLAHLERCARCGRAYERLRAVVALVQEQEADEPPAHFTTSLQVRLARHRRRCAWWRLLEALRAPWRAPARWKWASATAVLAAFACVLLFQGIGAAEVARRAGESWRRIRNYGCVFASSGIYQGQPRTFQQSQFFRRPGEYRIDTAQDYPLTTFVYRDRVVHYLPGGSWKGVGPLVIVRPRNEGEDALPFPFGVTWQNGGNVSIEQLIRQLGRGEDAELLGREPVGGRDCYHLRFSAVTPGGSRRDEYEMWVDRDSFLPRRVSWFRDRDNHIVTEALSLQTNYDVFPPGTFEFEIPEGAAVVRGDVDPHVLALPIPPPRDEELHADPVRAACLAARDRAPSVPFRVHSPRWLPDGFELIRVRRKIGRWVDMHWIRRLPSGEHQVVKLVEQDGSMEPPEAMAGGREVSLGGEGQPVRGRMLLRAVPYPLVQVSWRQGGTRFTLTAAEVSPQETQRIAASVLPVSEPLPPAATSAAGAPARPDLSTLPVEAVTGEAPAAALPAPSFGVAAPPPAAAEPPPMMPEMSEDDRAGVASMR